MTTTDANRDTLRQVSSELQRAARSLSLMTIAEDMHAALERAGELALDYRTHAESRFVAQQARAQ